MKIVLVIFVAVMVNLNAYSQNTNIVKGILEEWCETHFFDCFGWKFIDIQSVTEINVISESKLLIKGYNRNSAIGGNGLSDDIVSREFKAIITDLGNGQYSIKFKKQMIYKLLGETWDECSRIISLRTNERFK